MMIYMAQVSERWEVDSQCDLELVVLVRALARHKGPFHDKKMNDFCILRGEIKPMPLISIKMLPVSSYLSFFSCPQRLFRNGKNEILMHSINNMCEVHGDTEPPHH